MFDARIFSYSQRDSFSLPLKDGRSGGSIGVSGGINDGLVVETERDLLDNRDVPADRLLRGSCC